MYSAVVRVASTDFDLLIDDYYETNKSIEEINAELTDIKDIVDFNEVELTFNNDFYVNMNGQKSTGWGGHSQFIELKAGETIRAYLRGSGTAGAYRTCFSACCF